MPSSPLSSPHTINPYGYIPSKAICILFIALFGLSTVIHIGQAARYRMSWLIPSVILAGCMEVLGWSGRLWSSLNITVMTAFQIQIIVLLCGPTPLAAANFVILGRMIGLMGTPYSRLGPKQYATVFLICDITSLFIQGIGGGMAAHAITTGKSPELGGNIMLAGIVAQLVTITVYILCAAEFFVRYAMDRPVKKYSSVPGKHTFTLTPRMRYLIGGMCFNTTCLFIRAIYRVIELADGFRGRISTTQVYFNVLDGWMIVFAIITLNFAHPGFLLPAQKPADEEKVGSQSQSVEMLDRE
ncbi:RTA1-like protein [Mycena belliarum]|uniref:RTA1-like protein n=1 Tax=Mycena belliarum TaxID=1033014 RepID=A0AAD6U801_9AGAR|nr:RTA1-like protein [Mycena belliae]